jgi:hypothetical protein
MIVAITLSLMGVVYAGCWGDPADGGRGGALGWALTFSMLFLPKPTAEVILADCLGQVGHAQGEVLVDSRPAKLSDGLGPCPEFTMQAERLRAIFVGRLNLAERETVYFALASAVSARAWKFGDVAAVWLNFRH